MNGCVGSSDCRLCGRIFCGRCAALRLLPAAPGGALEAAVATAAEGTPVRVCNYCFSARSRLAAGASGAEEGCELAALRQLQATAARRVSLGPLGLVQQQGDTDDEEDDEADAGGGTAAEGNGASTAATCPPGQGNLEQGAPRGGAVSGLSGGNVSGVTSSLLRSLGAQRGPEAGHSTTAHSAAAGVTPDERTTTALKAPEDRRLDFTPPPAADEAQASAASAACRAALRDCYARHMRATLLTLLQLAGVEACAAQEWASILAQLAEAAAAVLTPAAAGASYPMDPREFLQVRKLPGIGRRADSQVVAGVVARKQVAHRRMRACATRPRLLLLGGALEYARVEGRLSSLDTLLEQERAHLRVAVARLAALRPDVLLVERSCARYAQELLLQQGVSLVLNCKPRLLLRLARATGAVLAPSPDRLAEARLGMCGSWRCDSALLCGSDCASGDGAAEPCTAEPVLARPLMRFDACPAPLAAAVLLTGASMAELTAVKPLAQWAVFAAHSARLECGALADMIAAAGVSPEEASDAIAAAASSVAARAAVFAPRGPPLRLPALSPFQPPSALLPQPPLTASSLAQAMCAQGRLVASASCRRTVAPLALCEPPGLRAIDGYAAGDVPLGQFLAAVLPGPGRLCSGDAPPGLPGGCCEGLEVHERSYCCAALRLRLRSSSVGTGAASGSGWWTWAVCHACAAAPPGAPTAVRRERTLPRLPLSAAALQLSLARFLQVVFHARDLKASCGHSLGRASLRFFGCASGTLVLRLDALPCAQLQPPPLACRCSASAAADWAAQEAAEVQDATASVCAELRAVMHQQAEDAAFAAAADGSAAVVAALSSALDRHCASLSSQASALSGQTSLLRQPVQPPFEHNRLRRALAQARRDWAAVCVEAQASGWLAAHALAGRLSLVAADASASGDPAQSDGADGMQLAGPEELDGGSGAPTICSDGAAEAASAQLSAPTAAGGARKGHVRSNSGSGAGPPPPATASYRGLAPMPALGQALLPAPQVDGHWAVIFDDELTSAVGAALASRPYATGLAAARESGAAAAAVAAAAAAATTTADEGAHVPGGAKHLETFGAPWEALGWCDTLPVRCLLQEPDTPAGASGVLSVSVVVHFAPQFEALRAALGVQPADFYASLSRCRQWSPGGGKSGVFMARTRDERFVAKALSRVEAAALLEFCPAYLRHVGASVLHNAGAGAAPSLLARIVGVFSVHLRGPRGRDQRVDLALQENVFCSLRPARVYDLKGSVARRYAAPGQLDGVFLDENLLEEMAAGALPICCSEAAAARLRVGVRADTEFLAAHGVMDYSLLVGCDAQAGVLSVAIIDYLRQYTWDKQLETVVKASGAALLAGGGGGKEPTIVGPAIYARRFRRAVARYFTVVPSVDDAE